MMRIALLVVVAAVATQPSSRMAALVEAVTPLLPFPAASPDGEVPADSSTTARWFVIWPRTPDDTQIVVKANPLHPEVQKESAAAMEEINAAIVEAERRAQAAYDKAMEQLRKTGRGADLETVTLDDEGLAGERIDAQLQVTIELSPVESFDIASSVPPVVSAGVKGASWLVTVTANTYRPRSGDDRREHFREAESRLYFGAVSKPAVSRKGDDPLFRVTMSPAADTFSVVIRGNAELVARLTSGVDWSRVEPR
jgi:hypothetical protein